MSGCSNKMVEDGNRKHVFIETSKVLVEVVYKKYKRWKGASIKGSAFFVVKMEYLIGGQ